MTLTLVDGVKIVGILLFPLMLVPQLVWLERKLSAWIQGRVGPERAEIFGIRAFGLFHPLADAIKLLFKEDLMPARAQRFLFTLAPLLVLVPPMLGMAILPVANQYGDSPIVAARLPIGILWLMSVLSIGVYGLAFGGWASTSKYSLLGGLRASAQMISYEMSLGLTLVAIIMMAGTVDPVDIVRRQADHGWNVFGGGHWYFLPSGIVALILLYTSGLAENNRAPFDLPECESELVAGYHTEYSSMKFSMFFMGEYVAMITMSALITTMLLGGWHFPGLTPLKADGLVWGVLVPFGVFLAKVMVILTVSMWVRWTVPRFKYNQLMNLGWKVLIPIALVNLAVVGVLGVLFKG
jgi:NADH-quinone oxidoreductase subunit H